MLSAKAIAANKLPAQTEGSLAVSKFSCLHGQKGLFIADNDSHACKDKAVGGDITDGL